MDFKMLDYNTSCIQYMCLKFRSLFNDKTIDIEVKPQTFKSEGFDEEN